eukprot:RCo016391
MSQKHISASSLADSGTVAPTMASVFSGERVRMISLSSYNGTDPITSPRSKDVLLRLGIVESDLRLRSEEDYVKEGFSKLEAKLRAQFNEERRKHLLEQAVTEYIQLCSRPKHEGPNMQQLKLQQLAQERAKAHEAQVTRNGREVAKMVSYVLQQEHLVETSEKARVERERQHAEAQRKMQEELRQQNQQKREATERRIQAALEAERTEMSKKLARYDAQRQAQEATLRAMEERRQQENERRREQNEEKEKLRCSKKENALAEEQARKARFLQKLEQQRLNMEKIMAEQARQRQEKQLVLSLRNEGVAQAVERSKRKLAYNKVTVKHRVEQKAAAVEKLVGAKAEFVRESRATTQEEATTRRMIQDWIENLKHTKKYEIPGWMNLDLRPYLTYFEQERAAHPEIDFDKIIALVNKPHQYRPHSVPILPSKERMYWAKTFWEP